MLTFYTVIKPVLLGFFTLLPNLLNIYNFTKHAQLKNPLLSNMLNVYNFTKHAQLKKKKLLSNMLNFLHLYHSYMLNNFFHKHFYQPRVEQISPTLRSSALQKNVLRPTQRPPLP